MKQVLLGKARVCVDITHVFIVEKTNKQNVLPLCKNVNLDVDNFKKNLQRNSLGKTSINIRGKY